MWPFSNKDADLSNSSNAIEHKPAAIQEAAATPTFPPPVEEPLTRNNVRLDYNYEYIPHALDEDSQAGPHRLGVQPASRILLMSGISLFAGFAIGSAVGGTNAGLRYRATNAHNVPTSQAGWYLYNKSKNYHVMLGGVSEGFKNGARYAGWTALFLGIEEGLDRARGKIFMTRSDKEEAKLAPGQRDFLNTVAAAVTLSGIYGWWHRFDQFTAARMTRKAVRFALPFGLAQDGLAILRGDRPWYLQTIGGAPRQEETTKQKL